MNIMNLFNFTLMSYNVGLYVKEKLAIPRYRKWIKLLNNNNDLFQYKKSDICYICGNGPSLNKVKLDELDGDTIVMNDYWRIADRYDFVPTYYIINDSAYAYDSLKERCDGVINCYPEIPHILTVYMGPTISSKYAGCKCNIFFFNNIGRTYNRNKPVDFTKCTYYTWNVVSSAIQLAIWLKYKKVYLLGCDYSLFASRYLCHVYDKENAVVKNEIKLRDMLFKYSITTHIHYEISAYAKKKSVEIINLTSETLLDAYDIDSNSKY